MGSALSSWSLATKSIARKPLRAFLLGALVAVSAAVLFASFLLAVSLRNGIAGMRERIGADLMIVPEGYERSLEGVLLSGEPNYFYMDKGIEDTVRGVEGVAAVTSQFYLSSLSESCCDFPVQIIGFDVDSDFLIKPWVQKYSGEEGSVFAGSNVSVENGYVSFFSKRHRVVAKLAKSGSGMDNAIFADGATVRAIFQDAKEKGFSFFSDGNVESLASAIFVRLADGAKADTAAMKIRQAVDGIQIVRQDKFIRTLAESTASFSAFLAAMSVLFLLVTVLSLALVFSLTLYERRREFSIMRVLGADKAKIRSLVLYEALVFGISGSLCGISLSALVLLPFNILISRKISMPFCMPGIGMLVLLALAAFVIVTASCILSASHAALRISKLELYAEAK